MRDPADRIKDNGFGSIFREKKVPKLPTKPTKCIDCLLEETFQILNTAEKNLDMIK